MLSFFSSASSFAPSGWLEPGGAGGRGGARDRGRGRAGAGEGLPAGGPRRARVGRLAAGARVPGRVFALKRRAGERPCPDDSWYPEFDVAFVGWAGSPQSPRHKPCAVARSPSLLVRWRAAREMAGSKASTASSPPGAAWMRTRMLSERRARGRAAVQAPNRAAWAGGGAGTLHAGAGAGSRQAGGVSDSPHQGTTRSHPSHRTIREGAG